MKRKVVRQGHNTLTVTLPKQWTEEHNIKAGDELDLRETEEGLVMASDYHAAPKTISLNVDGMERLALSKLLIAAFEQGFDTITLTFTKPHIKSWSHGKENVSDVINFFVSRLIGLEILSQTPRSITIGNVSEKLVKFEVVLSRIFFLMEEYLQHLIIAMKSGDYEDLKNRENRHDNITKFVSLATRMVIEDPALKKIEALNYHTILLTLDKATDFIRWAYKFTEKHGKKVSKETIDLAEGAYTYLENYRHFFYKFDWGAIHDIDEKRGDVVARFLRTAKTGEAPIMAQLDAMVESLNGLVKPRIALELAKGKQGVIK
jgi:phosphate uptake regulator